MSSEDKTSVVIVCEPTQSFYRRPGGIEVLVEVTLTNST